MSDTGPDKQTFWEHLDVLRSALLKIAAVTAVFSIIAFIFKDGLFSVVFAPKDDGFITYRLMRQIGADTGAFSVPVINTGLAEQFIIHMKTALCAGLICASPYILYQLFRFVSPALYADERRYALKIIVPAYVMFLAGALVSYYLIFPLTFRFLGTYQVSGEIANLITLQSYMETFMTMSLAMGIVFEMPVVCLLFGRLGLISDSFMRRYRKHAIVIILTVAAIITPTSDVFTLLVVSLPMWLLYEISIFIVKSSAHEPHAKIEPFRNV